MDLIPRSQEVLNIDYQTLSSSTLKKGGVIIIFGTFDTLYAGHLNILRTAKSLGDKIYIGIEKLEKTLIRKQGKHKTQSAFNRIQNIQKKDIAISDEVFVRNNTLSDM